MIDPSIVLYSELGDLRMQDIPERGFEIQGVPKPPVCAHLNVQARNHGQARPVKDIYIFADVEFHPPLVNAHHFRRRLNVAFPPSVREKDGTNGQPVYRHYIMEHDELFRATVDVLIDHSSTAEIRIHDALIPLVASLRSISDNAAKVFICHASEDKPVARLFAGALRSAGAVVWLDEWEIRVGDSIIDRINVGLEESSYLLLLLSRTSVRKPWVQKEFSAALMSQLSKGHVTVLPVRLDDCEPPALIADIKYADARTSVDAAIEDIRHAILA